MFPELAQNFSLFKADKFKSLLFKCFAFFSWCCMCHPFSKLVLSFCVHVYPLFIHAYFFGSVHTPPHMLIAIHLFWVTFFLCVYPSTSAVTPYVPDYFSAFTATHSYQQLYICGYHSMPTVIS